MRLFTVAFLLMGCGSSTPTNPIPDMTTAGDMTGSSQPTLTVKNTLGWCKVSVTVGTATPVVFDGASQAFNAASGTTVKLHADPHAGFIQVKWTGVTTMNAADATYTMTSAAAQMVTACCPFPDGSGC
jgi:hypothetical protein